MFVGICVGGDSGGGWGDVQQRRLHIAVILISDLLMFVGFPNLAWKAIKLSPHEQKDGEFENIEFELCIHVQDVFEFRTLPFPIYVYIYIYIYMYIYIYIYIYTYMCGWF